MLNVPGEHEMFVRMVIARRQTSVAFPTKMNSRVYNYASYSAEWGRHQVF